MTTEPNHAADRAASQAQARRWLATPGLLILDTETTGLDGDAEIVQIAVIWLADGSTAFESLVKPTRPIPPRATAIHGITDAMVADAPTFAEIVPQLRTLLGNATVLIYNAPFDIRVMEQSLRAHDRPGAIPEFDEYPPFGADDYIDVMIPYSEWVGDWSDYHGNYRWQRLPGGDHTAIGDCRAVREIILDMADRDEEHTITIRVPRSQRNLFETNRSTIESFAAGMCRADYPRTTHEQTLSYLRANYFACATFGIPQTLAIYHPDAHEAEQHALRIVRNILSNGRQTKAGILADLQEAVARLDRTRTDLEQQMRNEQRG